MSDFVNGTVADTQPLYEVADIVRRYGQTYQQHHPLPHSHQRVLSDIAVCRTAVLGGHVEECNQCGHRRPVYNSCRNRHCPKCQGLARAQWLADRQAELLPVGYFHNVFTLPHELNDLVAANQRRLYSLLFRSVADTLQAFAVDPSYGLGGQLGFTTVLHTWDQKLLYHVHLHCVIAGGVLTGDGQGWRPAPAHYLFPVRELSQVFRSRFLDGVQRAFDRGQLVFPARLAALTTPATWADFLGPVRDKDWVVYSQPPFGGPEKVLDYLSRYTHRIAISNRRIRAIDAGQVTFDYRDRRDGNQLKQLTLSAHEFLRRFLLHVTPERFCRLRHYGFLSNRTKEEALQRCRVFLGQSTEPMPPPPKDALTLLQRLTGLDLTRCPRCQQGTMVIVECLPEVSDRREERPVPCPANSS